MRLGVEPADRHGRGEHVPVADEPGRGAVLGRARLAGPARPDIARCARRSGAQRLSALSTASATSARSARFPLGTSSGTASPLRVRWVTEYGSVCMPCAAKVAYALAMRIALGLAVPSERAGTCSPKLLGNRPAVVAVRRTRSKPTSMPSCMIGVFTELTSAWCRLMSPQDLAPSLRARTILPGRPQYGPSGVWRAALSSVWRAALSSPSYTVAGVIVFRLSPRSLSTPSWSPAAYTKGAKAVPAGTLEALASLKPCLT